MRRTDVSMLIHRRANAHRHVNQAVLLRLEEKAPNGAKAGEIEHDATMKGIEPMMASRRTGKEKPPVGGLF